MSTPHGPTDPTEPTEPSTPPGVVARVRRAVAATFTRSAAGPPRVDDRDELRQLHARVDALDFRVRAIERRESP